MKLAVLTACYKRYELFQSFIAHIPKDITVICVGDADENQQAYHNAKRKGKYLVHENKPISNKWQAGLTEAKKHEFDYLIITGSDDFFCPDLWEWYKTLDVHYAGLLDMYFMDGNKVKYNEGFSFNRKGEPHGAGRALHRTLLDAVNWNLWDEGLNEGLDASMTKRFKGVSIDFQFIRCRDKGFVAMDVKTGENIHKASEYTGSWLAPDEVDVIVTKLGWITA